jgi:hypothetical protein
VALGPLPEIGMNENCVLTVSNGLRTIWTLDVELLAIVEEAALVDELAETLDVRDDAVVALLDPLWVMDVDIVEEDEEALLVVTEEEAVAEPNCTMPEVVSVTLFAWGAELVGLEVPGPLRSWYSV